MKRLIPIAVVVILVFAQNVWAAGFESLAPYNQAPQVKKYLEAWKKCGAGGDTCPNKESSAEAARLRDLALKDCFTTFGSDTPERVDPCKAAVNATPNAFSTKAEPIKPKPHPVVKPPDPIKVDPEELSEPYEPTKAPTVNTQEFVTRDEFKDELRMAIKNFTPAPQPPAPSNDVPKWLMFVALWNFVFGFVIFGMIFFYARKKETGFITQDQLNEILDSFITYERQNVALGNYLEGPDGLKALKASILQIIKETGFITQDQLGLSLKGNLEARALEERVVIFKKLKELEEGDLEEFKRANANDPLVGRIEGRIGFLDTHIEELERALKPLKAKQSPKQ